MKKIALSVLVLLMALFYIMSPKKYQENDVVNEVSVVDSQKTSLLVNNEKADCVSLKEFMSVYGGDTLKFKANKRNRLPLCPEVIVKIRK